jgi:hypothetical protein
MLYNAQVLTLEKGGAWTRLEERLIEPLCIDGRNVLPLEKNLV